MAARWETIWEKDTREVNPLDNSSWIALDLEDRLVVLEALCCWKSEIFESLRNPGVDLMKKLVCACAGEKKETECSI
jgi:hypothetical protein